MLLYGDSYAEFFSDSGVSSGVGVFTETILFFEIDFSMNLLKNPSTGSITKATQTCIRKSTTGPLPVENVDPAAV